MKLWHKIECSRSLSLRYNILWEAGEIGSEKKGNIHLLCTENTCTCTCMYQVLRNVSFFVKFCVRSKWMIPKGNSIQLRWGYLRYWQWHEGHYCWREKWVNAKYFLFLKYFKFQICLEYFVDKKWQFFGVPKKEIEDNKQERVARMRIS